MIEDLGINFYCLGAQKSGTTTLHDILKLHPNVFLPERKEAPYYQVDELYTKGFQWYVDTYFGNYNSEQIAGSVSPEFLYHEQVPKRIFESVGTNVKFIVLLRNPVDRAVSHYNMSYGRTIENLEFWKAVSNEKERIETSFYGKTHFSYVDRGVYCPQIRRYLAFFPKNNFLFIKFEDFIDNQLETTVRICEFLNIPSRQQLENVVSNASISYKFGLIGKLESKYPIQVGKIKRIFPSSIRSKIGKLYKAPNKNKLKLNVKERCELYKFFETDIADLEKLTGLDLEAWKVQPYSE